MIAKQELLNCQKKKKKEKKTQEVPRIKKINGVTLAQVMICADHFFLSAYFCR